MTFDTTLFYLISQMRYQNNNIEMLFFLILIPVFKWLYYYLDMDKLIDKLINYKLTKFKNSITIYGYESVKDMGLYYDYPFPMLALNYSLITEYNSSNITVCNLNNNGVYYSDDLSDSNISSEYDPCYILNDKPLTKLENDLYYELTRNALSQKLNKSKNYTSCSSEISDTSITSQVNLTLYSNNLNLKNFINMKIDKYTKYCNNKNHNKIYHFIFQGTEPDKFSNNRLSFTCRVLSTKDNNKLTEGFDHIFNEHSDQLKYDLKNLKNHEYYAKYGLKRKKGYLFYGTPGCGKTSSVTAMALYDNRHIIEIPFCKLKTNKEFEQIINLTSINGISFTNDEIILLFDEIDTSSIDLIRNNKINNNNIDTNDITKKIINSLITDQNKSEYVGVPTNDADALNIGILLSRLDGVGNYNGLVVIATTNHIDKLDPAFYRELRLTPFNFNYLRTEDIIKMIEKYLDIKLTDEQINKLPNRSNKITPAKLRYTIEKYINTTTNVYDTIINEINQ